MGQTWPEHARQWGYASVDANTPTMKTNTAPDHNYTPNNRWAAAPDAFGSEGYPLKGVARAATTMAVTESNQSEPPSERSYTVDLRDLDLNVPDGTTCEITIVGDLDDAFDVLLERSNNWVLEGEHWQAELTTVYGDKGAAPKPETVPDWLAAVCAEYGIAEVTL